MIKIRYDILIDHHNHKNQRSFNFKIKQCHE